MTEPEDGSRKRASVLSLLPRVAKLIYRLARDRRVPWTVKAVLAGLALYLASPIDLIPDWIPGAGYLDDLLITGAAVTYVLNRVSKDVIREHWGEDIETLESLRRKKSRPS
jgi:uncharacterized membrane protein YkvA (DUF1232 family)